MASFADLFGEYGLLPQQGGLGAGGDQPGFSGMRHGMVGLGLGLMSAPGGAGWGNAMKGYEQGAAIDSRSNDRRASLFQQAQDRALQRGMQQQRMDQQERQFQQQLSLHKQTADKPQISYFTKGYDDNNQPIPGARIFTPSTGTVREIPIEAAQKLEAQGVPSGGEPAAQGGEMRQQFADMPEREP
jgi:hypothetical protein